MLNRRHKAILFVTLVMTGTGLLAGAKLNEGLGILLLGAASAWLVGSEIAVRVCNYVRVLPGRTWPWTRILVLMALGACLLVTTAVWSNFNAFLVISAMAIWGTLISPFVQFPAKPRWVKLIFLGVAAGIFFLAIVGVSALSSTATQEAERIGELTAYGLMALPFGIYWIAKGWRLILSGLTSTLSTDANEVEISSKAKGTKSLHVSLFAGATVVMLLLGLLAFSAFSDSILKMPIERTSIPSTSSNSWSLILVLMLVSWWPYSCWKRIIQREPNSTPGNIRSHKRVITALGVLLTVVLSVGITFGIQNGYDRIATARVERGIKDFQGVAAKIGAIKSRDLRTTADYIGAYQEVDPLLVEFDERLQQFVDILAEAKETDRNRGLVNIQRLYGTKEREWLSWDTQIFELLQRDSKLTRKQVSVVKYMASLPEQDRVEYWNKNFRPLLNEESLLRQNIISVQATMPSDRK